MIFLMLCHVQAVHGPRISPFKVFDKSDIDRSIESIWQLPVFVNTCSLLITLFEEEICTDGLWIKAHLTVIDIVPHCAYKIVGTHCLPWPATIEDSVHCTHHGYISSVRDNKNPPWGKFWELCNFQLTFITAAYQMM